VETLRDGYGLKFTIARYYTPNGRSIQAQGIVPDIEVKHKVLTEEETPEDERMIKEKDLKNHLNAEPFSDKKKKGEDKDKIQKPVENRYGSLDIEVLNSDNQVMRALEILKGYQIFSDSQG
jgi:carboxyl-terminal processing protease